MPLLAAAAAAQPFTLWGTVEDEAGAPLQATVRLVPATTNHGLAERLEARARGERIEPASRVTTRDGRFELAVPEVGRWWLQVDAPGRAEIQRHLDLVTGDLELDPLVPPPSSKVTLRVENEEGAAVSGALVRVALGRERYRGRPGHTVDQVFSAVDRSGEDGVLRLELAEGERSGTVDVAATGFVPGATNGVARSELLGEWGTVTLLQGRERTLRITVDGEPREGVVVVLRGGRLPVARTDEDGLFSVPVPPAAIAESPMPLVAEAPGVHHHFGVVHEEPADGAVPEVAITTRDVSGVVVDENDDPVPGILVWLTAPDSEAVTTDSDGRFALVVGDEYPTETHPTKVHAGGAGWARTSVPLGGHSRVTLSRAGGVRVTFRDLDGEPVEGVVLSAVDPDERRRNRYRPSPTVSARSDARGEAILRPLDRERPWELTAHRPGYRRWSHELPPAAELEQPVRELEVTLEEGTVQVGWVVDSDDVPVPGATVSVRENDARRTRYGYRPWEETNLADGVADADGRFEIRDMPAGRFTLVADAAGFAETRVTGVEIGDVDSELGTIVLEKGHRLAGTVVDEEGKPVGGVAVESGVLVSEPYGAMRPMDIQRRWTDADGRFAFADLPAGDRHLTLMHDEYGNLQKRVELPLEEPLEIVLERGIVVPVRVVGQDGSPMEEAWMSWNQREPRPQALDLARMSGSSRLVGGVGEMVGLEPGVVAVRIHVRNGSQRAEFELLVAVDGGLAAREEFARWDGRELLVTFPDTAVLRGRVTNENGEPVPGGIVRVDGDADGFQGGEYRVQVPVSRTVEVTVDSEGYAPSTESVEIEAREVIHDVILGRGWSVSGWVRDSSGAPVPSARVWASSADRQAWHLYTRRAVTDTEGAFEVAGLAESSYRIRAESDGFAPVVTEPIEVDGPVTGVELEMDRGVLVHGRIVGLRDVDPSALVIGASSSGTSAQAEVAYDGSYRLENVPSGRVQLNVQGLPGIGMQFRTVDIPAGAEFEYDFALGEGILSGTVLQDGAPVSEAKIAVVPRAGFQGSHDVSDADGRFEITGLEEGLGELRVSRGGSVVHREPVEIVGDREIVVELQPLILSGVVAGPDGPILGAFVTVTPVDSPTWFAGHMASVRTDETGAFELQLAGGGEETYDVRAEASGHTAQTFTWTVGDSPALRFRLDEALVDLIVEWGDRAPRFARLALVDSDGSVVRERMGSSGHWTVDDVPAGAWTLYAAGGASMSVAVRKPVTIPEVPAGGERETVRVALVWPATGYLVLGVEVGEDLRQTVQVRLRDAGGNPVRIPWNTRLRDVRPVRLAAPSLEVPAGTWTIERLVDGAVVGAVTVDVPAGGEVQATLP